MQSELILEAQGDEEFSISAAIVVSKEKVLLWGKVISFGLISTQVVSLCYTYK